jgi:hypothetical protein
MLAGQIERRKHGDIPSETTTVSRPARRREPPLRFRLSDVSDAHPGVESGGTFVHGQARKKREDILCCFKGRHVGEKRGEGMRNEDAAMPMRTCINREVAIVVVRTGDGQIYCEKKGISFQECSDLRRLV